MARRRRAGVPTRDETLVQRRAGQRHGTVNMYGNLGCRCDECKAAASRHAKARRAARPKAFRPTAKIRFLSKVAIRADGCWEWRASRNRDGYGQFSGLGSSQLAHRVAYELFVGPIPEDRTLDHHVCFRTWCVNPDHLEPVDNEENVRRAWATGRYRDMWSKRRSVR
jgi:hypothetical protein